MSINQSDWNAVRQAVALEGDNALYRRVKQTVYNDAGEPEEKTGFEPIPQNVSAKESFKRIEADVERLIQEVQSLQLAERELRTALEEPAGAETPRR